MARRKKKDTGSGKNLFLFLAVGMLFVLVLDHLLAPAPRPRPPTAPPRTIAKTTPEPHSSTRTHTTEPAPFPQTPTPPSDLASLPTPSPAPDSMPDDAFNPPSDPASRSQQDTGIASPQAPSAISPQADTPAAAMVRSSPSHNFSNSGPAHAMPAWKAYATPSHVPPGTPRIAIIIDDVGIDRKRSIEAIALPASVTLAFLPYAHRVDSLASLARQSGHELLVHMPMEPMDQDLDPGQGVLTAAMDGQRFEQTLEKNLGALSAYVGINNHMGSRMTADIQAMDRVMIALKRRDLAFVDSRTTAQSVAARAAQSHGLPWAERHVFLDHARGLENVRQSLSTLEDIARRKGLAVAIGHPKDDTLAALRSWIPTLEDKGLALVPITSVLKIPDAQGFHAAGFSAAPATNPPAH